MEWKVDQRAQEEAFWSLQAPIGRVAAPEEIANLIVYTCSAAASGTTGAALRVDGGTVRSIL